jgi:hypothetical protein
MQTQQMTTTNPTVEMENDAKGNYGDANCQTMYTIHCIKHQGSALPNQTKLNHHCNKEEKKQTQHQTTHQTGEEYDKGNTSQLHNTKAKTLTRMATYASKSLKPTHNKQRTQQSCRIFIAPIDK